MLSDKVRQIVIAKGAPFTDAEMDEMADAVAWGWIYGQAPRTAPKGPEVCFTGFRPRPWSWR